MSSTEGQSFVAVRAAQRSWLVPLSEVVEVLPMMSLSPLRGARGACRGLLNLRGQLLPVFDLAGEDAPLGADRYILVARAARSLVGVAVDDVLGVSRFSPDSVALCPVGDGQSRLVAREGDEVTPVLHITDLTA